MPAPGETADRLSSLALLIPAWQPDGNLPRLLTAVQPLGFGLTVVVDDGSPAKYDGIFQQIAQRPGVGVLRHACNQGKGRALKTGMRYLIDDRPEIRGVVTADADGQHTPEDIAQVARALATAGEQAVLGVRHFGPTVPLRSRLGNAAMRRLFRWRTGVSLADTQTGLRGLPRALLPALAELPGERYEYETVMLAALCRLQLPPVQLPIATVYLEANRGSHFRPMLDSLRVLGVLLRL